MNSIQQLLTLPGNGVFTVHTAQDKKDDLLKAYYGTNKLDKASSKWVKELSRLSSEKPWLLGIPSDCGGGIQRGANWGPLMLRQELLSEKHNFFDLGDVRVIPHLLHDKYLNPETIRSCQKALYGRVNKLPVSPLSMTEKALSILYKKHPNARILGLGGDHSISYPLVKAWLESRKDLSKAGLLHFDAHTDLMDKRLGVDFCFGTWTYHILDSLSSTDHVVQVGIRSSGKKKSYWKKELGVEQYWASEVQKLGVEKVFKKLSKHYKNLGIEELYISFDIDTLDEKYASATGTPEKNGLLPSDCAALIQLMSQEFKITGADLMEVAPFVWPHGVEARDQQSSLGVAADITKVLLGSLTHA